VQAGQQAFRNHHRMIGELVSEVEARGPPDPADVTIAAHLLRIRDEKGRPLPRGRLQAEFSTMFGVPASLLPPLHENTTTTKTTQNQIKLK
jgi:hypothetical protein